MTATRSQLDIGDALNKLFADVAYLKQMIGNPSVVAQVPSNPTFESVTVDDGVSSTVIVPDPPQAITNLVVTPGTYYDLIYGDVSWDAAVAGEPAATFDIELARNMGGGTRNLIDIRRVGGDSVRLSPLEPDTNYSVRIYPVNRVGTRGPVSLWADFSTVHDSTVPPAPTGLSILRGATTVVVKFTGLTALQAPDVANGNGIYEIQIDTVNTFGSGNLRVARSSATIVAFSDVLTESATWYARVAAIDASGNQGAWSTTAGPATAGGVIDSMVVAGLDAAKITFGSMSGDRITTNTLHVNALLNASAMTAKTIEIGSGGQFKIGNPTGGPGTSGIYINDQGIRLYLAGTPTVILDALTGAGTFTGVINATSGTFSGSIDAVGGTITGGTIQTASTGQRTRLGPAFGGIELFSGHTLETTPGKIIAVDPGGGGPPLVRIEGPRISGGGAPQPYIDLVAGSGSVGYIDVNATTQIFLNSATVLLKASGSTKQTVNVNGVHIHSAFWMQENGLYFRSYNDTAHGIYWTSDQMNYNTSVKHSFGIGANVEAWILSNGLHSQDYIYAWGDSLRMGELYGNIGMYASSGTIRVDAASGNVYLSIGGSVKFQCNTNGYNYSYNPLSMERQSLYIKDAGDNAHRVYWHSGWDGVIQEGYAQSAISSILYDAKCTAGYNNTYVRCVNNAENAWRDVAAANIAGYSDVRSKRAVRSVERGHTLQAVRGTRPIRFEWQEGFGDDFTQKKAKAPKGQKPPVGHKGKEWLGLSSVEVPIDMQYDMPVEGLEDGKGINVMSAIAYLWGAVGDVADDQDDRFNLLAAQIAELGSAVDRLVNKDR